jgi:hypothetical protein
MTPEQKARIIRSALVDERRNPDGPLAVLLVHVREQAWREATATVVREHAWDEATATPRRSVDPEYEPLTEGERAERFLLDLLAAGPRIVAEVREAADAERLNWRTVEKAKRRAGIRSAKTPAGPWAWTLRREGHLRPPVTVG